jgi:glycosyltransferase involved in cell wall biosynthesis
MKKLKISYLITVHNEVTSLDKCITNIVTHKDDEDEILVLDDYSDDPTTKEILQRWQYASKVTMVLQSGTVERFPNVRVMLHSLNKNYGGHKNFGNEQCTGDWVFQIDGDEIPNPNLIINLKTIIEANPDVDLIYVPRINDFIGVTPQHALQWGWRLSTCEECDGRPIVNWPDYQSRIYRRDPHRIRWDRRLHEKIEGHDKFVTLPAETDLALYHDKTIETQMETNIRYNQWFTAEENQGHNVFDQKPTGSK